MKMRREPARTAIAATTEKSAPRGARRSSPFSHPHTSTKVEGAQTTARTRRYSSMKPGMRAVVLGRPSIRSAARAEKPVKSASILSRSTATVGKRRDRTTRHASRPNKRSKQLGCKAQPQGGQTRSGRAHGASQVSAPTRPTHYALACCSFMASERALSSTPFTVSSRSTSSMTATGARVAVAVAGLEHARIAAGAVLVARRQRVEELLDHGLVAHARRRRGGASSSRRAWPA